MTDSIAPRQALAMVTMDKSDIEQDVISIKNAEQVELALCHTMPGREASRSLPTELLMGMEITPTITLATATATTTTLTTTTAAMPTADIVTNGIMHPTIDQSQSQTVVQVQTQTQAQAQAQVQVQTQTQAQNEILDKNLSARWSRMLRVLSRCIVYCSVRIAAGFGISRQQSGWYKHCWDTPGRRPPDLDLLGDAAGSSHPTANSGIPGDYATPSTHVAPSPV